VEGDRDPGLVELGPHRIELGVAGRHVAVPARHGTGDHHDDAGAGLEDSSHLGGRRVRVGQSDHRRGVEPTVAAVVAPVVVEPLVERLEGGVEGRDVVLERLLHAHAEGGEQQGAIHPLLVEQVDPGVTVAVAGVLGDRRELAEHRLQVHATLVATPEVRLKAAGLGDRIEGGVRDELVDLPAHEEPLLAADVGPLHAPLGHRRVDVAGEGVLRLVVVVVGVEGAEAEIVHARIVLSDRAF
jgi:hypothetical protein